MRQKYVATMLDALRFDLEKLQKTSCDIGLLEEYEDAIVMASALLRGSTLLGFNEEGMKYD